jgi:hypothetical protein
MTTGRLSRTAGCESRSSSADGKQIGFGEDLLGNERRGQSTGKSAVDRGVQERLDDLLGRQPDVQRCVDMDIELRLAAAECGEHAEGHELALLGSQRRARVDIPEAVGDDLMGQLRRDVGQSIDYPITSIAVHAVKHGLAGSEPLRTNCVIRH